MLAQFFSSDQPQSAPNPSVLHSYGYKKGKPYHHGTASSKEMFNYLEESLTGRAFCLLASGEIITLKNHKKVRVERYCFNSNILKFPIK